MVFIVLFTINELFSAVIAGINIVLRIKAIITFTFKTSNASFKFIELSFAVIAGSDITPEIKAITALTHPTYDLGEISQYQSMIWHVFGHYRTGFNKSIFTNCASADNGRIRSNVGTFLDSSSLNLMPFEDIVTGIVDICKSHG